MRTSFYCLDNKSWYKSVVPHFEVVILRVTFALRKIEANNEKRLPLRFRQLSGETGVNQLKLRVLHGDESYDVDKNTSTPCLESRPSPPLSLDEDSEPRSSSAPVQVRRRTRYKQHPLTGTFPLLQYIEV